MALMRIKRPEGLKEHSPEDLGRLLGLDRAPEVKTVGRKLARLAAYGRAAEFGRALAERRVQSRGHARCAQSVERRTDAAVHVAGDVNDAAVKQRRDGE